MGKDAFFTGQIANNDRELTPACIFETDQAVIANESNQTLLPDPSGSPQI